jgi:allantoinase
MTVTYDLVIRGESVLTPAGVGAHEIGVLDGRISAVEPLGAGLVGAELIELADDETLIPGLVDTHVHVNEPGAPSGRASRPPRALPRPAG